MFKWFKSLLITVPTHYANCGYTICGKYIYGREDGSCIQHTTIKENVTCYNCRWGLMANAKKT